MSGQLSAFDTSAFQGFGRPVCSDAMDFDDEDQPIHFSNRRGKIASYLRSGEFSPLSGPAGPFRFLLAMQNPVRLKSGDTLA